jgi:periplasmic divalent cation tolerance protein
MTDDQIVALVTCPVELAEGFAQKLVEDQLAACINIVPRIVSVYRWQGAVETDDEALMIIKTARSRIEAIEQCLTEIHPNEVFDLITVPINGGAQNYLDWITAETQG